MGTHTYFIASPWPVIGIRPEAPARAPAPSPSLAPAQEGILYCPTYSPCGSQVVRLIMLLSESIYILHMGSFVSSMNTITTLLKKHAVANDACSLCFSGGVALRARLCEFCYTSFPSGGEVDSLPLATNKNRRCQPKEYNRQRDG